MRTSRGATPGRAARTRLAVAAAAVAGMTIVVLAPAATAADSLKHLADGQGFDIGFALDPNRLNETQYRQIADTEFNFVVAENAMKWDATEPNQGQFSWSGADAVASYAQTSGKGLYGHTLVWHSQLPGWAQNLDGTQLLSAMRNHITQVAGRYAGQVEAWDVVNEAFEDNGTRRQSVFQQRIGGSYIEEAFRAARAADPAAKLCINDYSTDGINAKSTAIYNLVRDFKARGVPIDCVGFQAHLIVGQVPGDMQQNLQRFADLGVDVRVTELDIRMSVPATSANLQQQARDYARVVDICQAVDRCQGVTIWGITDRYSWVPDVFQGQGAALVWDESYQPKPAYDAIAAALADGVPTPEPTPTPDPTPDPTGDCTATVRVTSTWPGGFQGEGTVKAGSAALRGWSTSFRFDQGGVAQVWNGVLSSSAGSFTVVNEHYNGVLAAGATTSFGFLGTGTAPSSITAVSCSAR